MSGPLVDRIGDVPCAIEAGIARRFRMWSANAVRSARPCVNRQAPDDGSRAEALDGYSCLRFFGNQPLDSDPSQRESSNCKGKWAVRIAFERW